MEASRTYHGGTFLGWDDLQEAKINHRVELEYYQTKNDINNILNEDEAKYGIEILKKEYEKDGIYIESNNIKNVCDSSKKVIEIINVLKKNKVTPVGLQDVLDDLLMQQEMHLD
ncbi:MAG: hypothetical protein E7310_00355 [Clostridiales bacterium]|nr:hypothetical protein [Clostridiales bacterium]